MEIVINDIDQIGELAAFYNDQIKSIPYCYPVTPDEMLHEAQRDASFIEQCLIVGRSGSTILGFAHLAMRQPKDTDATIVPIIRFLSYQPRERRVGEAILQTAEKHFTNSKADTIFAFRGGNYNFYRFGFAPQSQYLSQTGALLGLNGYRCDPWTIEHGTQWVLMKNSSLASSQPMTLHPEWDILFENQEIDGMSMISAVLTQGNNRMGYCLAHSLRESNEASEAHTVFYVRGLEIDEAARGKGLGRQLMTAMHWKMQQEGHNCAVLYTAHNNYRAQLLYTSMGYTIIDTAFEWHKAF